MAYVLTFRSEEIEEGLIKIIETKGSSSLVVTEGRSFFIPKKHIRDVEKFDEVTIFLCEDWEYSEAKSHYDESAKQFVKDPIVYVKGKEVIKLLSKKCFARKYLKPKVEEKVDDDLPF